MIYTINLPLEVSKRPLKYKPNGITLVKGDKLNLSLKFFDELGNLLTATGYITFTGYKDGVLFRTDNFELQPDGAYKGILDLNTEELLASDAKIVQVLVKFTDAAADKKRTISFYAEVKEKIGTGADPTTVPAFYPEPDELYQLIEDSRAVIQEKRVSQKNINDGYITLDYNPEAVTSVVVAGGTAQYGSYDPEEASFEPDYYIDSNFTPARLVWQRFWSDNKAFPLAGVIRKGDNLIITYNRLIS